MSFAIRVDETEAQRRPRGVKEGGRHRMKWQAEALRLVGLLVMCPAVPNWAAKPRSLARDAVRHQPDGLVSTLAY